MDKSASRTERKRKLRAWGRNEEGETVKLLEFVPREKRGRAAECMPVRVTAGRFSSDCLVPLTREKDETLYSVVEKDVPCLNTHVEHMAFQKFLTRIGLCPL